MNPLQQFQLLQTRRQFFGRSAAGIGTVALASLLNPDLFGDTTSLNPDLSFLLPPPALARLGRISSSQSVQVFPNLLHGKTFQTLLGRQRF